MQESPISRFPFSNSSPQLSGGLLIPIPFRSGKVSPQFVRCTARPISWSIPLYPPAFLEGTRVHGVKAKLVEQMGNFSLSRLIITRDRQCTAILGARWLSIHGERSSVDVIERLYDFRRRQVCLQQFRCAGRLIVEFGDITVPLRIEVVRIDHDFSSEWRDRHLAVVLQRDGHDDNISSLSRTHGGRGSRLWAEFFNERGQGFRSARVADDNVVAVRNG